MQKSCLSGHCKVVLGGFNALFTAARQIFASKIQSFQEFL